MRKLTTPTVLAFERNLDISDAVFTQFNSQDKNPVEEEVKIREKSVREQFLIVLKIRLRMIRQN